MFCGLFLSKNLFKDQLHVSGWPRKAKRGASSWAMNQEPEESSCLFPVLFYSFLILFYFVFQLNINSVRLDNIFYWTLVFIFGSWEMYGKTVYYRKILGNLRWAFEAQAQSGGKF